MAGKMAVAAGILWWMLCGSAVTLGIMAWRGRKIHESASEAGENPFGAWLGKPCWIRDGGAWRRFRVVAVSHKGAVNVRPWDDDGARAFWVHARDVPGRVRIARPEGAE